MIGINDLEIDDFEEIESIDNSQRELTDSIDNKESDNISSEDDLISQLLKSRGVEDKSKIKFENEEGVIEEKDWGELSNEELFNILNSSIDDNQSDYDLDDDETSLINAIRESGMSPSEYLQKLLMDGVNNYIQNNQTSFHQYLVDLLTDDELFVYDFISRMGDITEEEAQEALEKAKSNLNLFTKLIEAIRKEYKRAEDESIHQAQIELEALVREQYDQFANQIAQHVDSLSDFSGYDLNMDDEDKQLLYDFIVGVDGAGNNYFAKALSDPKILVKAAWLILNGEQMISDITEYFLKEISNVRKESYEKGKNDANKDNKLDIVYKNKSTKTYNDVYDDLD